MKYFLICVLLMTLSISVNATEKRYVCHMYPNYAGKLVKHCRVITIHPKFDEHKIPTSKKNK